MSSIVASFFNGFLDAISFHNVVLFILTSKTIRMRALQCLILNGVIFLGSIMLAEWFVIPFLKHLVTLDSAADGELSAMVQTAFVFLYQTFWIYPIYALSFVLNTIWYQDIAEYAFVIHGHKTKKAELSFATWLQAISEEIYRALLIGCYFIQITLFSFIPYVGTFIFGAYLSWLYALYSFEYRWALERWELERKLSFFESRWPYFAGFGCPAALFTFIFPNFVSQGVFALTFPMFIILAIVSKPSEHFTLSVATTTDKAPAPALWQRLPIFGVAKMFNSVLLGMCGRCRAAPPKPLNTTSQFAKNK